MMKINKKLGMYIHIPFCLKKCFYCDFYSVAGRDEKLHRAYVEALIKEIKYFGDKYSKDYVVDTIFIGGGTPSILPADSLGQVMKAVRAHFVVEDGAEVSMECNPATLTLEKLGIYRAAGINRLSMGAQSFEDDVLKGLGRIHSRDEIINSYHLARQAGFDNINLDVMFGVPGQDMEKWKSTVKQLLELNPEHISFYSLELAENTAFYDWFKDGTLVETEPELDRKMYHYLLDEMKTSGYNHYEISNGAKAGKECKHNLKYWCLDEYLGLGPSAHSYVDGYRFAQTADLEEYLAKAGTGVLEFLDENSREEDITDYMFTALRKTEGIKYREFREKFQVELWDWFDKCKSQIDDFVKTGLVAINEDGIRITSDGMDVANRIIEVFLMKS